MPIELLINEGLVTRQTHISRQRDSMNISDSIKKLGIGVDKPVLDKGTSSKSTEKTPASATPASKDNVTLSAASVQMQSIEAGIASSEVFDTSKVDEIKSAIARGDFTVDTGKVADGLLQTVKDLIHSKKG